MRRRSAVRGASPLAGLTLALLLGGCTRWFFFPDARLVGTPADLGYGYRDVAVTTADGVALHAWLIEPTAPPDGTPAGTVYFLHGNAENISTHVRAALWLVDAGYRVFALDYRGYGRSAGRPDIPEVFEDIRAGAAWLFDHLGAGAGEASGTDDGRHAGAVHLFAQSLGASLAIRYLELEPAQRARFASLTVESAFTRYGAMARQVARGNPFTRPFGPLAEHLLEGPHDPLDAIRSLAPLPILVVHSPDDRIVPYAFGVALHAAAGEPKSFVEARGAHISAVLEPRVRRDILDFMRRHERGPPSRRDAARWRRRGRGHRRSGVRARSLVIARRSALPRAGGARVNRASAGFSIVELMIAMLIGSMVVLGVLSVHRGSEVSRHLVDMLSEVQGNGRVAMKWLKQPGTAGSGLYDLSIVAGADARGFTAQAVSTGSQVADGDCPVLAIDADATRSPAGLCW